MEEQDLLTFIDQCLKKFEYPNVHAVNFSEIFAESNRKFLLSWLYSLFQGDSMNISPDETLSEFLSWFCKSSQIQGILKADMEYPVQLKILYKIFHNLDSIKTVIPNNTYTDVTIQDTKVLCGRDMNIFKNFGPIRLSDEPQISSLEEKIKSRNLVNDDGGIENEELDSLNPQVILEKLIEMERNVKSATAIICNILRNGTREDLNIEFENTDVDLFRSFNKLIEKGKRYIADVEALSQFNEDLNNFSYKVPDKVNDQPIGMAKEIVTLIHDINNM